VSGTVQNFGTGSLPHRFQNVTGFLDKAMRWRRRAQELRMIAGKMATPAAQSGLLDMAAALEHHAANIEQIVVKFDCIRQTAAVKPSPFVLRRRPAPSRQRS
jgi:hypothetical protein